jgi:hypothetical protein
VQLPEERGTKESGRIERPHLGINVSFSPVFQLPPHPHSFGC